MSPNSLSSLKFFFHQTWVSFLAALSSSRSLVVCPLVRLSVGDVCETVTFRVSKSKLKHTCIPTYETVVTVVTEVTVVTVAVVVTVVTVVRVMKVVTVVTKQL